jgi:hypothetical protein
VVSSVADEDVVDGAAELTITTGTVHAARARTFHRPRRNPSLKPVAAVDELV